MRCRSPAPTHAAHRRIFGLQELACGKSRVEEMALASPGARKSVLQRAQRLAVGLIATLMSNNVHAVDIRGKPPPVQNSEMAAGIEGEAGLLSRFISTLGFGVQVKKIQTEIFSEYSDAECARSNAFFEYQVCLVVMNSKELTADEKLEKLYEARREIYSGSPCRGGSALSKRPAPGPIAKPGQPGWINDGRGGCYVWDSKPAGGETATWTGECRDGIAWGFGTEVLYDPSGNFILSVVGELDGGQPSGPVKQWWASGNRYEGKIVDGKRNGRGTYLYANGNRYDGDFVDNRMTGRGTYVYAEGDRYDGDFVDGNFTGHGTFLDANGNRYEGEWRDDLPNGNGTAIYANGSRRKGVWNDGCLWTADNTWALFLQYVSNCKDQ